MFYIPSDLSQIYKSQETTSAVSIYRIPTKESTLEYRLYTSLKPSSGKVVDFDVDEFFDEDEKKLYTFLKAQIQDKKTKQCFEVHQPDCDLLRMHQTIQYKIKRSHIEAWDYTVGSPYEKVLVEQSCEEGGITDIRPPAFDQLLFTINPKLLRLYHQTNNFINRPLIHKLFPKD